MRGFLNLDGCGDLIYLLIFHAAHLTNQWDSSCEMMEVFDMHIWLSGETCTGQYSEQ